MYSTAKEYLYKDWKEKPKQPKYITGFPETKKSEENIQLPFKKIISHSPIKPLKDIQQKEKFEETVVDPRSQQGNCQCNPIGNTSDPKVWGPAFWYSLHTSASHYPLQASPLVRDRMKGRILAIPFEVPCQSCRVHASAFIEKNKSRLDEIVSGRHSLGEFYVNFHNQVNKRYGKPEWTYAQAYKRYAGSEE